MNVIWTRWRTRTLPRRRPSVSWVASLAALLVVSIAVVSFAKATPVSAASGGESYSYNSWVFKPGFGWLNFTGNGSYKSTWSLSSSVNWFSRHDGGTSICPVHSDLSAAWSWLKFYHGTSLRWTINTSDWPGGLLVPGGCTGVGGYDDVNHNFGYSPSPSGFLEHSSGFFLRDSSGTYGGVTAHAFHQYQIW